ncbi:MAG: DNA repair protein RecO [Bacteroidota bacterium]|nr:DNA repair protein RecO [Bacteroidota bacterium]
MIYSTKGIVLRAIKYGETSVIASIFTEMFGIQSYMVNGVRTSGKTAKGHFFQPSSLLDLQVYHNELKNLQRIKELKWCILYKNILSDVTKNSVALYMVELLQKCLKQPEANPDLFYFCEDAFLQLDVSASEVTANFPIYFSLQLADFFGFRFQDNYSEKRNVFNLQEGNYSDMNSASPDHLSVEISYHISQLLKAIHPEELNEIRIGRNTRKEILKSIQSYYAWHIPEFGTMKTLPVLSEILG